MFLNVSTPLLQPLPRPKQNVGRYFVDEKRLIDYVLVYKDVEDEEKAYKRTEFEEKLKALGFELQEGPLLGQEKRTVLVHCPFNVLSRHAEIASIRKPVSVNDLRMKMVCFFCVILFLFVFILFMISGTSSRFN